MVNIISIPKLAASPLPGIFLAGLVISGCGHVAPSGRASTGTGARPALVARGIATEAAAPARVDAKLDAAVTRVLSRHFTKSGPGAAVLIANNGNVTLEKYYGMADVARGRPITSASVFDLASMSKQFTATAVLLLIAAGKFSLSDPVTKVLPDYKVPIKGRAVTIGDLVYHISGLADYSDEDQWQGKERQFNQLTTETHLRWINGTRPRRAPGIKWEYNNSGYALLALIVERASGMSFAQFVQTHLFRPAGMSSTLMHHRLALHNAVPNLVTGYKNEQGRTSKSSHWTQITGDGNVLTTLDDMARWDRALRRDIILNRQQKKLAWSSGRLGNHQLIHDEGYGYGFGWNIDAKQSYTFHLGSWAGTSTYIIRYLDSGLTIVVLSNDENAEANEIGNEIENVLGV